MDLDIGGGAYSLDAPISVQDCINLYPEVSESGARAKVSLKPFPGLSLFGTADTTGCRGAITMDSVPYFVFGTVLYSVSSSGTATSLGTIPGTGRVSMAHNGATIVIVNGTATGYTYTVSGGLATISDTDFLSADQVLYLDTYFVFRRTATNQFFISAAGDGTAYDPLDFASKEGAPGLLTSILVNHRDLILGGEKTMEFWRNTGNADFPFERQEGTLQERGILGGFSPAANDNTFYFLGDDRVVYSAVGFKPVRISNHALEKWLADRTLAQCQGAVGLTITWEGHYWYILAVDGGTWAYDVTTSQLTQSNSWFQIKSPNKEKWTVNTITEAYGKYLCGDESTGSIYELSSVLTENGASVTRQRTTRPYYLEGKRVGCPKLELVVKTGVGDSTTTDPQISLEISKDGGTTWHSPRLRDLGGIGERSKRLIWRRNGKSYDWVFRWKVTDPVDVQILAGYADFRPGLG